MIPYIYRTAFEKCILPSCLTDANGYITDTNDAFRKIFRTKTESVKTGAHVLSVINDMTASEMLQKSFESADSSAGYISLDNSGSIRCKSFLNISIIKDLQKKPLGSMILIIPFDEPNWPEHHPDASAEKIFTITETIDDGYWVVDMQGFIIECNRKACEMLGYTRQELLSKHLSDIDAVETPDIRNKRFEELIEYGASNFFSKHRKKSGELIDVEINNTYWESRQQIIGFSHNISTELQLKKELVLATRKFEDLYTALNVVMTTSQTDSKKTNRAAMQTINATILPLVDKIGKMDAVNQTEVINIINETILNLQLVPAELTRHLTPTEIKIAQMIIQGYSSKEMADIVKVSIRTIENYRLSIRKKINIKNTPNNLRETLLKYFYTGEV